MEEALQVDHTYIAHVKQGYEKRRLHMQQLMNKHRISNYTWMLNGDISDISNETINQYFSGEMQQKAPATSCALKHIYIYEAIVKANHKISLVLEDDMFFFHNFNQICNSCVKEIQAFQDENLIASLENSTQQFIPKQRQKKDTYLYAADKSRAAGAYLITLDSAKAILKEIERSKCNQPIDWYQNSLIKNGIIKYYWCEPPVAEQGSHNGVFKSSIDNKAHGWFRRIIFRIQIWMKTTRNKYF